MNQLPDPNRPLTVTILRAALEGLEEAGHGDTPVALYVNASSPHLIQAHNVVADASVADRPHAPAIGFCSTWDAGHQGDTVTSFVIL